MVTLIVGKKGSGKTKKLIERANEAVKTSNGNVVVIEKGLKLTYDISQQARLVDSDSYSMRGMEALAGFVSCICAGNYDVTDIFVDSTLKIIGQDMQDLEKLVERMNKLSTEANTNIILLVSAEKSELPEGIESLATQI